MDEIWGLLWIGSNLVLLFSLSSSSSVSLGFPLLTRISQLKLNFAIPPYFSFGQLVNTKEICGPVWYGTIFCSFIWHHLKGSVLTVFFVTLSCFVVGLLCCKFSGWVSVEVLIMKARQFSLYVVLCLCQGA